MKSTYENKVQSMIDNFNEMRKPFKWENEMVIHFIALTYAMKDLELDINNIKDMKDYIKSKTGAFSAFRGHMMFALSGLLSTSSDDPKKQFDFMLENQKAFKSIGFKNDMYLPTALYALSRVYQGDDVVGYGEKAMSIYKDMKQNHPFLTSGDDYALAILLAGSDHSTHLLEEYYEALHYRGFSKSNGLQMLSHIVSFSEKSVMDTTDRCEKIHNHLKENKLKVYADYYPAIGLLSLLDVDLNELLCDLVEVTRFLNKQKKYKWLGKGMNLLMTSGIITSEYIKERKDDAIVSTTISVSIEAIIAAQQAAMIAAMIATTAVATNAAT